MIGGADNKLVRNIYYDKLAALLPGGINSASELTTDASNILDIVSDNYRVRSLFYFVVMFKLTIGFFSWVQFQKNNFPGFFLSNKTTKKRLMLSIQCELKLGPGTKILWKYDWMSGFCCPKVIKILLILIDK